MENNIQKFQNVGWEKPLENMNFSRQVILDIFHEHSVLDLGCGDGFLLKKLVDRDQEVKAIGLDISPIAIQKAREKNLNCSLYDIARALPFDDNTFESVLLVDVLEHMFQPELLLKEAIRVSDQYVYISVPNFASLPARIQVLLGHVPENNTRRKGHIVWFTHSVFNRLLSEFDLEIVEKFHNTFWEKVPILGYTNRLLTKILPSIFSLSFVVKTRKKITDLPKEKEVIDYYDNIYRNNGISAMRTYDIYQTTFGYFGKVERGKKFLDNGTGTGYMLKAAQEASLDVYGTDISPEAISVAKKVVPQAHLTVCKGENLPFEDGSFDYVSCFGSLEHFLDVDKGLEEMVRVAKDDAKFLIIVPNRNYWLWWWQGKYGTKQSQIREVLMDYDGWKNFFDKHGLRIMDVKHDQWPKHSLRIFKQKNLIRTLRRMVVYLVWMVIPIRYTYQFCFLMNKKNP